LFVGCYNPKHGKKAIDNAKQKVAPTIVIEKQYLCLNISPESDFFNELYDSGSKKTQPRKSKKKIKLTE
jgi:hypothetical protein